ncbi:hypothetical protein BV210_05170 [Halorientalis sp. IM1011]|uniref:CBS domain-containing protein n=1 Tax=Halorientalis sp. IM1011 TaxID=1932360 RepID=UPI00097CD227|nr:CBS domain-containing protein [Halorientalis sp. IM1011]AQL42139.1 hypothetical protein BV210_05170 [Halorientalis sp. IM1011]
MDFQTLVTRHVVEATPDTRLGTVRSRLEDESTDAVLVVDGEVRGAILPRDLLRSRLSDDAEAQAVMRSVPTVEWGTDAREIARLLVENETTIVPVVDDGETPGAVTRDSLLREILDDLDALDVADVHTRDPVTVEPETTMGEVINTLRENNVSRLPVVDDGDLVSVATTDDLVEFVTRATDAAARGDRGGDKPSLIELPVENVTSRPAETITPSATLRDAVEKMFDAGVDGLVVVGDERDDPGTETEVRAVLTKTDVLGALTYTDESHLQVQVTNPGYLREIDRAEVAAHIESITEKFEELDVLHARVDFQRHDEQHRGDPLVRCQARLFTDETQLAGTGEGYGGENALSIALDKLERNLLDLKEQRTADEGQRSQVRRKLQNL